VRGGGNKSCSVRAHHSSFSTPDFTPGSLSIWLPIPDLTQSYSITLVQTDFLIVSMRTSLTAPALLDEFLIEIHTIGQDHVSNDAHVFAVTIGLNGDFLSEDQLLFGLLSPSRGGLVRE
jgi:hypothetical protein